MVALSSYWQRFLRSSGAAALLSFLPPCLDKWINRRNLLGALEGGLFLPLPSWTVASIQVFIPSLLILEMNTQIQFFYRQHDLSSQQDAHVIPNSFLTRHRNKACIALFIVIVIVIIATIFGIRQMHRLQISTGTTPQVIIVIILSISLFQKYIWNILSP